MLYFYPSALSLPQPHGCRTRRADGGGDVCVCVRTLLSCCAHSPPPLYCAHRGDRVNMAAPPGLVAHGFAVRLVGFADLGSPHEIYACVRTCMCALPLDSMYARAPCLLRQALGPGWSYLAVDRGYLSRSSSGGPCMQSEVPSAIPLHTPMLISTNSFETDTPNYNQSARVAPPVVQRPCVQ